jgi:L-arabonate dehydrase
MEAAHDVQLRSAAWFNGDNRDSVIHRSSLRAEGLPPDVVGSRPVIGIANTGGDINPCNSHLGRVAEAVKRGVWEAGGLPLEFGAMSLAEPLMRPTTMLYRNLLAMETEELLRAYPLDGVVLLSGCDKTTPGLLMGAASTDLPAIVVTGGPKLNGKFQGKDVGSGTSLWAFSEDVRAGRMTKEAFNEAEGCMARSNGHCMTMGTASTMASITEAIGMQLPGGSAIPAADARRYEMAHLSGRQIVRLVEQGLTPSKIMTRAAFENAIRVNAVIGGSTNAVVHLLALAGRLGVSLSLDDFDRLTADVPVLVNLMPSGHFLMEDFYYAGGLPAAMNEIRDLLHLGQITVTGKTIGENITGASCWNREVITSADAPFQPAGSGTVVLRGSLAPRGAVLKVSAASPELLVHTGPALVFDTIEEYNAVADDESLPVTPDTVLIVRNAGPRGYPGFPEVGNMALPRVLLNAGITDMVRISDARMSGTGFGTCILHVAPEAAVGGPLALVRTGDQVLLDTPRRRLDLLVDDAELDRRRAAWRVPDDLPSRGWERIYADHILQADQGADLDVLVGGSGPRVPRGSH